MIEIASEARGPILAALERADPEFALASLCPRPPRERQPHRQLYLALAEIVSDILLEVFAALPP